MPGELADLGALPIEGQIVHQIGQGFGVHEAMLDGDLSDLIRYIRQAPVDDFARAAAVGDNFIRRRPIRGRVGGLLAALGIDAEGKQTIKTGMKGRNIERRTADQVPIECFEMPEVEYEPMPFRDRPVV